MIGTKTRRFTPLPPVTLEELVPADHFYRHLDRVLDLAFVRDLVRDCYAAGMGRPSLDPVVFFKLHLVMFFEGIRSERQLLRLAADRLSVRWYLGYNLNEPMPDHSSLTRIRARYGVEIFRRFFEAMVEQCQRAGLVWGRELYVDATQVQADAAMHSLTATARFAVEARAALQALQALRAQQAQQAVAVHLADLFPEEHVGEGQSLDSEAQTQETSAAGAEHTEAAALPAPPPLPVVLSEPRRAELTAANALRHDWIAQEGRQQRESHGHYQRTADFRISTTDPDATPMRRKGGGTHVGYQTHYVVDGWRKRIIVGVLVTPGEVMENQPIRDLLWHVCFRWKLRPRQVTGDTTYGTGENLQALEEMGIRAYMPLPDWGDKGGYFGLARFRYDAEEDLYRCPQGQLLRFLHTAYTTERVAYRAKAAICNVCPAKARCTPSVHGRVVHRSFYAEYFERVRAYQQTPAYEKALRKRQVWVEPLFAEAKEWHGLRRFRLRLLWRVNSEALLIAAGQNLKRLLQQQGWGRRPFPSGAAGVVEGRCDGPWLVAWW
jgi:transposase